MRRTWEILVVVAVAVATAASASLAGAQTRPTLPGQEIPEGGREVVREPTARFSWTMKDRYADGWRAWNARTARYDRSYVRPSAWTISLNACASSGNGPPIERYTFRIEGVGFDFSTAAAGSACRRRFNDLPRLGSYDVRVVVRSDAGASAVSERVTLRDWLIVSLGDSMASGEGNPDRAGRYRLGIKPKRPRDLSSLLREPSNVAASQFKIAQLRPVRWQDKRCHRSALAGHALAARKLEASDQHSSVTFVSLACSGAEIRHLLSDDYAGQQPPSIRRDNRTGSRDHRSPPPAEVPPQLDVLADLLGARAIGSRGRRVDALFLSIGINDLHFSTIVEKCASNFVRGKPKEGSGKCVYDTGVTRKIERKLGPRYDELGGALDRRLNVSEVYMTDYPSAPFGDNDGASGLLGLPRIGITGLEAGTMYAVGLRFAEEMRRAAARNGWNFVPGMTEAFTGHDYRQREPYLRRLEESVRMQGTVHGAVHPNRTGHRVLAGLLGRSLVLGRGPLPDWRARITVEQVRVPSGGEVRFRLHDPSTEFGVERRFDLAGAKGEWVQVPEGQVSFDIDLCEKPAPPRCATAIDAVMTGPGGTVPMGHTKRDGYGAGSQESLSPQGLGVRYRVEVTRVFDPRNPPRTPVARR